MGEAGLIFDAMISSSGSVTTGVDDDLEDDAEDAGKEDVDHDDDETHLCGAAAA